MSWLYSCISQSLDSFKLQKSILDLPHSSKETQIRNRDSKRPASELHNSSTRKSARVADSSSLIPEVDPTGESTLTSPSQKIQTTSSTSKISACSRRSTDAWIIRSRSARPRCWTSEITSLICSQKDDQWHSTLAKLSPTYIWKTWSTRGCALNRRSWEDCWARQF